MALDKHKLQSYAEPMSKVFKKYKNKEFTESQLCTLFKLEGNEVRYVISKCVHELGMYNLINLRDKTYIYTDNKKVLLDWWNRKNKIQKPKYMQMAKVKKMCKGA